MIAAVGAPEGCVALAPICAVLPIASASAAGVTFSVAMPDGSAVTVMATAWLIDVPPDVAVTVIVATPVPTAVTTPAVETDAIVADDEA